MSGNKLETGTKHDADKPNLALIPLEAMWELGASLTYGAKKYESDNFRKGLSTRRQLAAALRHIYQALDVEDIDQESGCKHLGNAMASISMALFNIAHNPEFDDRYWVKRDRGAVALGNKINAQNMQRLRDGE